ncbi:MAG: ABC-F family ATP-binding cassette domain-containing protein [Chloroflexota bacterium]
MTLERLRLSDIRKYYGAKLILDGIDLTLSEGDRLAIVGENGVGKSTLAHIITGEESADSGNVLLSADVTVGYLSQDIATEYDQLTVQAYIEWATGDLNRLRDRMQTLETRMTEPLSDDEMAYILMEYGRIQALFEQRGGYELDSRIEQIFAGLAIDYLDTDRRLHTLSGGERTRVALTGILLRAPDVLILDEPTNHLDFAGIRWLEDYLRQYPHALLLITHDRRFLNRVANVIAELNATTKQLHIYHGDYDDYLAQRERDYQQKVDAYNNQKNEMRALERSITQQTHNTKGKMSPQAESDKFIRFFKNSQSDKTQRRKIKDAQGRLADIEANKLDNPRHEWRVEFRFDPHPLPSAEPLRLIDVHKAYDSQAVLENVSILVPNSERVVIVAPNGSGKSTLLRFIMGLEPPDAGTIRISPSAILGYLDQDGDTLGMQKTVIQCFREVMDGSDSELLAELHRSGLFSDASLAQKRVADLSVGQRRKLGLARLVASQANLLLLDEPTNHLDPLSIEALEDALLSFGGTILAVSHDRRFINKVATQVWHIENHQLIQADIINYREAF